MAESSSIDSVTTRVLDAATSVSLLAKVVEQRIPARCEIRTNGAGLECTGSFIRTPGAGLAFEMQRISPPADTIAPASVVNMEFELEGPRYRVESRSVRQTPGIAPATIFVVQPTTIASLERRRSRRRDFREPVQVTLETTDGHAAAPRMATMLNLSGAGMACRVRETEARDLRVQQELRAAFRAGGSSVPFSLICRVVTLTHTGVAEHVVLGLEFMEGENLTGARIRLRGLLDTTS